MDEEGSGKAPMSLRMRVWDNGGHNRGGYEWFRVEAPESEAVACMTLWALTAETTHLFVDFDGQIRYIGPMTYMGKADTLHRSFKMGWMGAISEINYSLLGELRSTVSGTKKKGKIEDKKTFMLYVLSEDAYAAYEQGSLGIEEGVTDDEATRESPTEVGPGNGGEE